MDELFSLKGKVAIVTGGTGVLGGAMVKGLAQVGARVGVLGRRQARAEKVAEEISKAGGEAIALPADILRREQLKGARDAILEKWGRIDILVNAAGGNVPGATLSEAARVFDLPLEAFREVFDLNLLGTLLPSQVFGEVMAKGSDGAGRSGCIVNVSSMAAQRPLTRVAGYSAAKAAVNNLTKWLAVELSRRYGAGLRVTPCPPATGLRSPGRGRVKGATPQDGPQAAPDGRPPALFDPFVVGETRLCGQLTLAAR